MGRGGEGGWWWHWNGGEKGLQVGWMVEEG